MTTNPYRIKGLNDFEKGNILIAFARCWGLKNSLKTSENDKLLRRGAIESLAYQSGLRKDYIEKNLEEILKL